MLKTLAAILFLGFSSLLVVPSQQAAHEQSGEYTVDPVHSSILFSVKHLGVADFYGRFNVFSGELAFDADLPEESYISIEIQADSVDTHDAGREKHLKGPDFFNAREFPEIKFESSEIEEIRPGTYKVTGDLMMKGKSKTISFEAVHTGHADVGGRFGYRTGYRTSFTFKRSDFDMTFALPTMLGDEVKVIVSLEAQKKD